MSVLGTLFLTLSAATPASSVFVIVPDVISQAGTGALISRAVAAVIAVLVAQVYAELGSAFPFAGGEYAIVGRIMGPLAGFVVLGLNLVNTLFATAVLALGVSDYLSAVVPGLSPVPVALAVVGGGTLLGVLNIRTNASITGVFVAVEIVALAVVAGLGLLHPSRGLPEAVLHPVALAGGALSSTPLAAIGLSVAVAIFAYDGYGSAVYFGEELHQAPRRIARAILWALGITVVAEVVPLIAVLTGAPDLAGVLTAKNAVSAFVMSVGGPGLARVMGVAVGFAIMNAVIAMVLLAGRQLYSTGRDLTWPRPISAALAAVHPRFGSPWLATLVGGGLTAGLCLVDLKFLLIATGTGVAVIYAILCGAALVGRANGRSAHAPFRMRGFPAAPVLALLTLCGVLWADGLDPAEGRPGLLAAFTVAVVFGAYYLIALRRRGWVLSGPQT